MGTRNDYLPCKCWFENGKLHRAFFEYDDCPEHPRDFSEPLSVIVNASKYNLGGSSDIDIKRYGGEDWLISETGINEDWYYANKERYGGIEGLAYKFEKEKCMAFEWLTVYDHSGITVSCGRGSGWDYSWVGFVYVPKDNADVKAYRKNHTLEETKKWASDVLHAEIEELDKYCRGDVYGCIDEVYDAETETWERNDSCWNYYVDNDKEAIDIIEEFSGDNELFDEDVVLQAIEEGNLDVLQGQQLIVFEFEVPADTSIKETA